MQKIKLHARVTREIEITEDEAKKIKDYLNGNIKQQEIADICWKFLEGVDSGYYDDAGYIPSEWLEADLGLDGAEDVDL